MTVVTTHEVKAGNVTLLMHEDSDEVTVYASRMPITEEQPQKPTLGELAEAVLELGYAKGYDRRGD